MLNKIYNLFINAKIGLIEVNSLNSRDSQKIFEIINSSGTKLKAVEILSAKPSWNLPVKSPSSRLTDCAGVLYQRIGTTPYGNVVKWDLPATILKRLNYSDVFFSDFTNSNDLEGELTLGFKLLSGIFNGGITKEKIDELGKNSLLEPEYEDTVNDLNIMTKIVLDSTYFKYLQSWHVSVMSLLSEACALNFLLLLFKDWKRKNSPTGNNASTKSFQKNAFILFDAMVYEYTLREWRGSSDSKIANNLANIENLPNIIPEVDKHKWQALITEIIDNNKINEVDVNSYSSIQPILFHFYCLKNISGPSTDCTIEVDHIIPSSLFDSLPESKQKFRHNLVNLGLLPKRENISKGNKRLIEISDPWLKGEISKYEFITEEDFKNLSNMNNFQDLMDLRKPIFLDAFDQCRDFKINN